MSNSNSSTLIKYMQWADNTIFNLISELPIDDISYDFGRNIKSIKDRLYHLAEDHLGWYCDVTKSDWKPDYEKLQTMEIFSLISYIQQQHEKWITLLETTDLEKIDIDEGDGLVVQMTLEEVAFNLANHASYHRGQIMTLLRAFDKKGIVTDYKFYKISTMKNKSD